MKNSNRLPEKWAQCEWLKQSNRDEFPEIQTPNFHILSKTIIMGKGRQMNKGSSSSYFLAHGSDPQVILIILMLLLLSAVSISSYSALTPKCLNQNYYYRVFSAWNQIPSKVLIAKSWYLLPEICLWVGVSKSQG
jgi:hypothetical protein